MVAIYNSTLCEATRSSRSSFGGFACGINFLFDVSLDHKCMLMNLTNVLFKDNQIGVFQSTNCTYELQITDSIFGDVDDSQIMLLASLALFSSPQATVKISNCLFINNFLYAMLILYMPFLHVTIMDTVITQNSRGIILVGEKYSQAKVNNITIKNTIFSNNFGVSLGQDILQILDEKIADISLQNVTFFNNTNPLPNSGIIQVDGSTNLNIDDLCIFENNHGASVSAVATTVTLSGVVIFKDNIAYQGGALLLSNSMVQFRSVNKSNTYVLIENNTALTTGGGIYIMHAFSTSMDP